MPSSNSSDFSIELHADQTAILTISVHGNAKHFKKAEDLVAKSPRLPGWTIVALENPRPIHFLLEQQIYDSGIDPRELYFSFASDESHNIGLTVYHPLCTRKMSI